MPRVDSLPTKRGLTIVEACSIFRRGLGRHQWVTVAVTTLVLTASIYWLLPVQAPVEDAVKYLKMMDGQNRFQDVGVFALRPLHPAIARVLRPAIDLRLLSAVYTFATLSILAAVAAGECRRNVRDAVGLGLLFAGSSYAVTIAAWNFYIADGLRNVWFAFLVYFAARDRLAIAAVANGLLAATHPSALTAAIGGAVYALTARRRSRMGKVAYAAIFLVTPFVLGAAIIQALGGSAIAEAVGESYIHGFSWFWERRGLARTLVKLAPLGPWLALVGCVLLTSSRQREMRRWLLVATAMIPSIAATLLSTADVARALTPLMLLMAPYLAAEIADEAGRATRLYLYAAFALLFVVHTTRPDLPSGSGAVLYGMILGLVPLALAVRDRLSRARSFGFEPLGEQG